MKVRLIVVSGLPKSQEIALRKFPTTIGRHRECKLRITSRQVSRYHCILEERDGLLTVRDTGSSNGTFVNGKKIQGETALNPSDNLMIGSICFRVEYEIAATKGPAEEEVLGSADIESPPRIAVDDGDSEADTVRSPGPLAGIESEEDESEEAFDVGDTAPSAADLELERVPPPADDPTARFAVLDDDEEVVGFDAAAESEAESVDLASEELETEDAPFFEDDSEEDELPFFSNLSESVADSPATDTKDDDDFPFLADFLGDDDDESKKKKSSDDPAGDDKDDDLPFFLDV